MENDKLFELVKIDPFLLRVLEDEDKTREVCRAALEALSALIPKYELIANVPYSDVCLETLPDAIMNEEIAEFILEKNPLAFPILKDTYFSPELCLFIDRDNPNYFSKYPSMLPRSVRETVNVFTLSRMLERRWGCGENFSLDELKEILQGKPFHIKESSSGKNVFMELEGGRFHILPEERKIREIKKGHKL